MFGFTRNTWMMGFAVAASSLAAARVARAEAPGDIAEGTAPGPLPPESTPDPQSAPTWAFELGAAMVYTSAPVAGGTTPFGLGFGGRAGFVSSNVYVGVRILDYLGGKDIDVTDTALLYGAELGYDIPLGGRDGRDGGFFLRPRLGAGGISVFRTDPSLLAASSSKNGRGRVDVVTSASGGGGGGGGDVTRVDSFYVEPGLVMMFVTRPFFFAVEANVLAVPSITYDGSTSTWLAYGLQGQSGFRF